MRRLALALAALCSLATLFLLVYPVYVIRPFRYQGRHELQAALFILQYRLIAEILFAAAAVLLAGMAWRRTTTGRRIALAACGISAVAFVALSRINIYEKMFHPMERAAFSAAAKSSLSGDEQVIAVRAGNAARAYPIRILAYHHIVNDELGGRAIVATY